MNLNSLDEIKHYIIQNFKLEDLIKEDCDIKKSGSRLMACCPFHEENTPSFYIFSDHYHCFGCKAHGDAISYVREKKGLGFIETLEYLGAKLGIDTSPLKKNKIDKKDWENKSRQLKAFQLAQDFFVKQLFSPLGKEAYHYIKKRGFSDEQIKAYGFGFALNSPNALAQHLHEKNFSGSELEEYSLVNNGGENKFYDFFRGRVMIPIRDIQGKLIAFGGRTLLPTSPQKYKNSRYDKKYFLFGLDHAHKAIKKTGKAIVVEGYLDAMRLWSLGLDHTVACQGTAFTFEHMQQLKNLAREVYVLFDGDRAGRSSALKLVSDSQRIEGVSFYFTELPEGEDPDSYTGKNGIEKLGDLLKKSLPLIEFVIKDKFATTPEQRTPELLKNEILPWIKSTKDPLERAYFLKKVSELSGLDEATLKSGLLAHKLPEKKYEQPLSQQEVKLEVKKEHSIPFQQLPQYVKDLFGHLYFAARSDELDLKYLKTLLTKQIHLDYPWSSLAEELFLHLEREEGSCFKEDPYIFPSVNNSEVGAFIFYLREHRGAFTCENRAHLIQKLMREHEKAGLQKQIFSLRGEIQRQSENRGSNYKRELLLEITELYRRLTKLQQPLS